MKQINPSWRAKGVMQRDLATIAAKKIHAKKRQMKWKSAHGFATPPATCSQCKRGMRGDIAKLQIENKRENAPICFACCMGYKRKT